MIDNINFLDMTKKECQDAGKIAAETLVVEATQDQLKAYIWAKSAIDFLSSYVDTLHEYAMEEYETYGEKKLEKYGRKISAFETGVKYNYSNCGHPDIEKYELILKNDKDRLDKLQNELKSISEKRTFINEDTGELFEVKPPIKTSTTKIKIEY